MTRKATPPQHRSGPVRRGRWRLATVLATALLLSGAAAVPGLSPAAAADIDPDAYYQLIARHSGKAIDIDGASTADAAAVIQWAPHTGQNQQFRFVPSGDGYYRIMARHSGKVLDVYQWNPDPGAEIRQWPDLNGTNQQFQVLDSPDGYVRFINRFSGLALDVWERSTADGARISQFTDTGSTNQQFQLVPVDGDEPPPPPPPGGARQLEDLDRGVVSVRSGSGNFVSWRLLGTDPADVSFNVYRGGTLVNPSPITSSTNLFDPGAPSGATYTVRAVVDGTEQPASGPALQFGSGGFRDVPIQPPGSGYTANDGSVGDLDGDGQYEIVLQWDGPETRDNSQAGFTSLVYVDAYELTGQRLWRINLGRNIRAGAHYTQFQVYDYDGDGRAEVAMKTADATVSGTGQVIGNGSADHRNSEGYILTGPEFLTMFDGQTGAILDTASYLPPRGNVCDWGDCYGNRVDRFLAGTAYLDGQRPSLVMARGYYTRSVIAAWDFRNGSLTQRWVFDSDQAGNQWAGQGNHQLSIADVDSDGRDEVVYGSMVVDDDGTGMWTSGRGHGDALHVGDFLDNGGVQIWQSHEANPVGADLHTGTGQQLWNKPNNTGGEGPGRSVAGDVYAGSPGAEFWAAGGGVSGLYNTSGGTVGRVPSSANFLIWWDADPVRELLDQTRIDKYGTGGDTRLLTGSGVASNNGTKANPVLSGDLFGDWREEVIWRTTGGDALRIYTTDDVTSQRLYTLMHDAQYRVAIAGQNTAYNQPPHPSFFLGSGMSTPPPPHLFTP